MKILLLFPQNSHSLTNIFKNAIKALDHQVYHLDTVKDIKTEKSTKILRLLKRGIPKYGNYIDVKQHDQYNQIILEKIENIKPDVVLSYNDNKLNLNTLKAIKTFSKFILFLADNPFYSFNKKGFLELALNADHCIIPDSGALKQLKMIGIENITYSQIGYDPDVFKAFDADNAMLEKFGNDIIYIGNNHWLDSWAYKRPLMLNYLTDFDIRVFGNKTWTRVIDKFPELKNKFTLLKQPMSIEELNIRMNCSKIYPVDHHPGILNGIHTRVFDAIAGNILPIVEYRKDVEDTFNKVRIPVFHSFQELKQLTSYYLKHNTEREKLLIDLREFIQSEYKAREIVKALFSKIL